MKYKVLIERYAQKQIMKLDRKIIPVIKASIIDLADNPRPYGSKNLKEKKPTVFGLAITVLSMKLTTIQLSSP